MDVFVVLAKKRQNHRLSVLIAELRETLVGISTGIISRVTRLE